MEIHVNSQGYSEIEGVVLYPLNLNRVERRKTELGRRGVGSKERKKLRKKRKSLVFHRYFVIKKRMTSKLQHSTWFHKTFPQWPWVFCFVFVFFHLRLLTEVKPGKAIWTGSQGFYPECSDQQTLKSLAALICTILSKTSLTLKKRMDNSPEAHFFFWLFFKLSYFCLD